MKKILCTVLGVMLSIALIAPVSAEALTKDGQDVVTVKSEDEIRSELTKYGVEETIQDTLMNKLKWGELWDSANPERKPINSVQINISEYKYTYQDGSIKITNAPTVQDEIENTVKSGDKQTRRPSVSGVVNEGGGVYVATYSENVIFANINFRVRYYTASTSRYLEIRDAWVSSGSGFNGVPVVSYNANSAYVHFTYNNPYRNGIYYRMDITRSEWGLVASSNH